MKKFQFHLIVTISIIFGCLVFQESVNGQETTGQETTRQETTGQETTGQETTGQETTGQETTGQETTGQETTGQETTGQETTGQETTGQETTGQETTGQETTGQETNAQESYQKNVSSLTKITFEELLNKFHNREKIYLYLGAAYCGYCRILSEELPKLNLLLKQKLYYYDVDSFDFDDTAFSFLFEILGIPGIPAILSIENEAIIEAWIGDGISAEDLYQLLTKDEVIKDEVIKDEVIENKVIKTDISKSVYLEKIKLLPNTGYNKSKHISNLGMIFLGLSCLSILINSTIMKKTIVKVQKSIGN